MFKQSSRPDLSDKRDRFAQVAVLVADSDVRTAELVRRVLFSFGFRKIFVADNPEEALQQMRAKRIELVITESRMDRGGGIRLVRQVRGMSDDQHLRRDIPIIMLTAESEKDDVLRARDAGITEFLVKPFSAKTLSHRIVQVIDNPRVFVQAANYAGPCRRRREPAPDGVERRKPPVPKPLDVAAADTMFAGLTGLVQVGMDKEAAIFAPNTGLQMHLGAGVRAEDILSSQVVAEAEGVLQSAESEFLSWARDDIAKLEAAYQELKNRPGDPMAHHLLLTSAYSIKAQAGIFGYDLGTRIGKMLVDYMQQNPTVDANRLVVVRKHIDAINVIFNQQIKAAGQVVGQELIASLNALVAKMG